MEIKNTFDIVIQTIFFVPFGLGIGYIGSIYFIYHGFKEGIVFNRDQLFSDNPYMTGIQKFITGLFIILLITWLFFVEGIFFRYLDGVIAYLEKGKAFPVFTIILISSVIVLLFYIISILEQKSIRKAIESELSMNEKILFFPTSIKIISIVSLILSISLFAYTLNGSNNLTKMIHLSISSILIVAATYWLIQSFFVKISFDEQTIFLHSPWKGDREVPIKSLKSYKFSKFLQAHVFSTDRHGTVRLSIHLKGLINFFDHLEKMKDELNPTLRKKLRYESS